MRPRFVLAPFLPCWLTGHRIAYRYVECAIESIVTIKGNRADSECIIAKYIKITDPKLAATEFDFVTALMPDYPAPTLDGIRLILDNFAKEHPDAAPRRGPREFWIARLSTGCGYKEVFQVYDFNLPQV